MSDFIFAQNTEKTTASSEYYCLLGLEDFLDDNNTPRTTEASSDMIAKKIIRDDSSVRYSIRVSQNGRLFNPIALHGAEKRYTLYENSPNAIRFKDVNFQCFQHYINFLKTKNVAFFNNSERESI